MNRQTLRIAFFGEDAFSAVVLESLVEAGHEISIVVIPEYGTNAFLKISSVADKYGLDWIHVKNINSDVVVKSVSESNPDLGVSAHFTKIIKKDLLTCAPMGFINLHPARLPYYRGATPQHWQIINGETESAITVHYINSGIDTGDIVLQRPLKIGEGWYVSDLQKQWLKEYRTIMVEAIQSIMSGVPAVPQPDVTTEYYGFLKDEDYEITEDMTVSEAYGRIRGLSLPYAGARFGNLTVFRAEPVELHDIGNLSAGLYYDGGQPYLILKDGILKITKSKKYERKDS